MKASGDQSAVCPLPDEGPSITRILVIPVCPGTGDLVQGGPVFPCGTGKRLDRVACKKRCEIEDLVTGWRSENRLAVSNLLEHAIDGRPDLAAVVTVGQRLAVVSVEAAGSASELVASDGEESAPTVELETGAVAEFLFLAAARKLTKRIAMNAGAVG